MADRRPDGSAGDADYGAIGPVFARYRQPEPSIAELIDDALGAARSVLNVGAGAGSYEPAGRQITAVEPSGSMRAQRPRHLSAAIDAVAEDLPFPDGTFDASMATFTVHQWSDLDAGLAEMRRVTRGPVVIMSCDPDLVRRFWLDEYAPDVLAAEARRYPALQRIAAALGGHAVVRDIPIPLDCADGFNEAYYGRPSVCWRRERVWRARPGASSRRTSGPATSTACGPIWIPAAGTRGTASCADRRHSTARCA